jgi:hypothetical protein
VAWRFGGFKAGCGEEDVFGRLVQIGVVVMVVGGFLRGFGGCFCVEVGGGLLCIRAGWFVICFRSWEGVAGWSGGDGVGG